MDALACCCSALLQKRLLPCDVVEMNFVTDKPSHAYECGMEVIVCCCSVLLQKRLWQWDVAETSHVTNEPAHIYNGTLRLQLVLLRCIVAEKVVAV